MDEIHIDSVVRSRRRTIALVITPEARLIVRAPLRAPASLIDDAVWEKAGWIRKKMAEIRQRPKAATHAYEEGEIFWFLGRPYPLHIADDDRGMIERTDRLVVSRNIRPGIPAALQRWYIAEAKKEINARCMYFSMMTGYSPTSIAISGAQKRWGSCSTRGSLNFSWRLIQAPLSIVDYVIVHELVHLKQHDHSKKFWAQVQALMPDYASRRRWLQENERLMRI